MTHCHSAECRIPTTVSHSAECRIPTTVSHSAEWRIPYAFNESYDLRDKIRFVCFHCTQLAYRAFTGEDIVFFKQPSQFMTHDLVNVSTNTPEKADLKPGLLILGNSYIRSDDLVYPFEGIIYYGLFTYKFKHDNAHAHFVYNCQISDFFETSGFHPSFRGIERQKMVLWSDFSPANDVFIRQVSVRDRYSLPSLVTFEDVCWKRFANSGFNKPSFYIILCSVHFI